MFAKLVISKILDIGNGKTTRTLDASAAAKRVGTGPIELWLSYGAQVDSVLRRFTLILSYVTRVATSLCRLLFKKVKVNEALLFMTTHSESAEKKRL